MKKTLLITILFLFCFQCFSQLLSTSSQEKFAQVNPNPFQNKLFVNIQSPFQDKAILTSTDMSGRQLLKQTRTLASGTNQIEINGIENFYQGSYNSYCQKFKTHPEY
ncbi:MAG: hypothetical protein ABIY62_06630 [Ginsengibacter sp.]